VINNQHSYKNLNQMKKILTIISLTILFLANKNVNAQKITTKAIAPIKEAVTIINTSKRGVTLLKGYFTPAITKKILQQITVKQFNNVKMYSNEDTYPDCIKDKLSYNPAKPDEDASEVTLKGLKIYRIATFDNIRNGENFGEESILLVPAKENKNVGGDCSYAKDFYIIIPTSAIEVIK
jgi:hypothetical protein